jgi:hypothetical protein
MAIDLQATTASGEVLYNTGSTIDGITPSALVASATQSVNTQTGTTYTLVLADANRLTTLSNASAITLTVPPNSSVAVTTGAVVPICQLGVGQVTVAAGVGVTVNPCPTFTLKLLEQYAEACITKVGTNAWVLTGLLEAV